MAHEYTWRASAWRDGALKFRSWGPADGGPADTTPPVIQIQQPVCGAGVSGVSVQVSASASDDVGISQVQFRVDTVLTTTIASPSYAYQFNSLSMAEGVHILSAAAFDAAGNSASHWITFKVENFNPLAPLTAGRGGMRFDPTGGLAGSRRNKGASVYGRKKR